MKTNRMKNVNRIATRLSFAIASLLVTFQSSNLNADVFNDAVDIVIDDVSAGVGGVAIADQVPLDPADLELEHMGAGGFDVDINPALGCDFFVTITHFAPIDGFPIGSYEWKIGDIQLRDADGNYIEGRVVSVELPPGEFNAMPTTGIAVGPNSLSISTGGFGSMSGGALNDYLVRMAMIGDVNRDCTVNLLDVTPFVEKLTTGEYQAEADTNGDGVVNLLDVSDFVELLSN